MYVLRKIYLLIWKNFLLRRKHIGSTAGLVLAPLMTALLVVYLHSISDSDPKGVGQKSSSKSRASKGSTSFARYKNGFEILDPVDINIGTSGVSSVVKFLIDQTATEKEIAFSPNNDNTALVMREVINLSKGGSGGSEGTLELNTSFSTEAMMENYLHSWKDKLKEWKPFRAAVVFPDKLKRISDGTVQYKIRMVGRDLKTQELFQKYEHPPDYERYKKSGFMALQILTDNILLKMMTNGQNKDITLELQEFPLKSNGDRYKDEDKSPSREAGIVHESLGQWIVLGFFVCVPNVIRGVISEKQSGIKELMQMMGLSNWMHWTGWMLDALFFMGSSLIMMTFLFFYPFKYTGVLNACSVTLWLFVMFLYLIAIVAFCFFISTFFSKATLAIAIGQLLYIASYFGLAHTLGANEYSSTLLEKIASALIPNMALHWAIKIIVFYELPGNGGADWLNIAEPINDTGLSMLPICAMLIVDIFLYMSLTLYLEKVLPSEYGLQKPWYYIFQLSTWVSEKKETPAKTNENMESKDDTDNKEELDLKHGFEAEPTDLAVGIEICNLTKKFDKRKMAVNGISAKMYNGEITALLGHNGAGKTTTLSILTGLISPTSGTAFIKGYDIATDMDEIRKSLGLCPQFDMLFEELTVEQHLIFFGRLKGLSSSAAKYDAQQIIWRLKLSEKAGVCSMLLSGGQKRRLSLANAVVGGSSVLILDEPSSGLDPEARREVWDMLLALRGERTIVLTTHFMEEADVLGDRILIMAEGKIQCSGTSLFLKKFYGNGYTIILTTKEGTDTNPILSLVQKYIPQAFIDTNRQQSTKSELIIILPEEFTSTSVFPDLFGDLAKHKKKLGILTIGSSIATMDDVFVRVGELNHPVEENVEQYEDVPTNRANNCTGFGLFLLMFWGLMIKLFIRNIRNTKLILLQLLPPIIAITLAVALSSNILRGGGHTSSSYPLLKISLEKYSNPVSICKPMSEAAVSMCEAFKSVTGGNTTTLPVGGESLVDFLMKEAKDNPAKYRKEYVVAAEMNKTGTETKIKVMYSPFYTHTEPLAINIASNTILKLVNKNSGQQIEIVNHPLKRTRAEDVYFAAVDTQWLNGLIISVMFILLLSAGLGMLAASLVIFPTEERITNGKQLQRMVGVSPWFYWMSAFLWDFTVMVLITIAMLVSIYVFQPHEIFTVDGAAGVFFLICAVYYFSIIPLSYLTSCFCSSSAQGYSRLVTLHSFTSGIAPITMVLELFGIFLNHGDKPNEIVSLIGLIFRIVFSINPTFGFALCVFKFAALALKINRCNILQPDLDSLCKIIPDLFYELPSEKYSSAIPHFAGCCKNVKCPFAKSPSHESYCYFKKNEKNYCHNKERYLAWDYNGNELASLVLCTWEKVSGIGKELLVMFIVGVIYYTLLFLVEYGILKKIKSAFMPSKMLVFFQSNYPTDDDVIDEAARVHAQVFGPQEFEVPPYYNNDMNQSEGIQMSQENSQAAVVPMDNAQKTGVSKYQNQNVGVFFTEPTYQGTQKRNSGQSGVPMANTTQNSGIPVIRPEIRNNEGDEQTDQKSISNKSTEKKQTAEVAVEIVPVQDEEDALLVQNLCKGYKNFAAVSNISFGVKHGECFGLLGVNGAGKTTTFRMLTGDETPSLGNAIAEGYTLRNNKSQFVSQFGYCPQFDAIIPFMTGKEMLMFYGRLRGVPPASLKREVNMWLAKLGLTDSANVISKKYSGGMKRRLGAGMALVGHPPIILLDEPTSGVDPISRRQFWKIISSVKEAGQAVILTSHSMEECEALCSRLGIMVNGQFQCFGGVQHLKNKFGQGHSLTIKLKTNVPVDNSEENPTKVIDNAKTITDLQNELVSKFQSVILKDQHTNVLQYQLLDTAIDLGQIFKVMEELKGKFEIIEQYSVGDTTLEQVFLSFARQQYGNRSAS